MLLLIFFFVFSCSFGAFSLPSLHFSNSSVSQSFAKWLCQFEYIYVHSTRNIPHHTSCTIKVKDDDKMHTKTHYQYDGSEQEKKKNNKIRCQINKLRTTYVGVTTRHSHIRLNLLHIHTHLHTRHLFWAITSLVYSYCVAKSTMATSANTIQNINWR